MNYDSVLLRTLVIVVILQTVVLCVSFFNHRLNRKLILENRKLIELVISTTQGQGNDCRQ